MGVATNGESGVETFVMVIAIALVIFGLGVAIGADIQDRMAEQQRRRIAQRHRDMRVLNRHLQDRLAARPIGTYLLVD